MKAVVSGSMLPVLDITLQPGEKIISETGELSWKTPSIILDTKMSTGGVSGVMGALGRAMSGGGLFMTEYGAVERPGTVSFAAKVPGSIIEETLDGHGHSYIVHRGGFICGTEGVTLGTYFQRSVASGLFGGNGFLLQKVSGQGTAWMELGGDVVVRDLDAGQSLDVHPGHVGMFEHRMSFEVTALAGIKNKMFGGDGLFMVRLTGPGRVWLQTLTLPNLATALKPYMMK